MTDKLLNLPKSHLPKFHRPRLKLKRRHRHEPEEGQAAESITPAAHAIQPEDEKDDNGDEPLPAVQRMQAESSELITLFALPESEVCTPPLPPLQVTIATVTQASSAPASRPSERPVAGTRLDQSLVHLASYLCFPGRCI